MNAPTTIRAGDSLSWVESLPEYPASAGWVLHFRLLWPTGTGEDIATAASGDDHAVTLAAADTADWAAGNATLAAWVTNGAERKTIGQTAVTILPDLATTLAHDGRSQNKRALDAAQAARLKYLEGGQGMVESYDIAGRSMKFRSLDELDKLIKDLTLAVAKETAALALLEGRGGRGRVLYRSGG